MIFEISIQSERQEPLPKPLRIKAEDWFTAMREGLPKIGISVDGELQVSVLEDELSAVINDAAAARKIFILALPPDTPVQPTAPQDTAARAHMRFDSQPVPVMPSIKPDTFSLNGAYVQGATTDFLAEAFMKVGDLFGSFGADLEAAMSHLFAMLQKATRATGGGLMLADINDPQGRLRFAFSVGPQRKELAQVELPGDQGVIGHSIRHSEQLNLPDLTSAPGFSEDPLAQLGLDVGPAICAPVHFQGQLLGFVLLYKARGSEPFAQGELNIFSYLSDAIGQYLHRRAESLPN